MDNLLLYLMLIASVLVGGLVVIFFKPGNTITKLLLAFSGSYLFAICILHLMPELYSTGNENLGLYILCGFFLQILLELFSKGVEHGHAHLREDGSKIPVLMMVSLCLHAFLEGMPLGSHQINGKVQQLLWGIVLHKVPIAITLMALFYAAKLKMSKSIILLGVFAIMAPMGAWLSGLIEASVGVNDEVYFGVIMGLIIGILIHISTTILFESSTDHRFNLLKFASIICGAFLAFVA